MAPSKHSATDAAEQYQSKDQFTPLLDVNDLEEPRQMIHAPCEACEGNIEVAADAIWERNAALEKDSSAEIERDPTVSRIETEEIRRTPFINSPLNAVSAAISERGNKDPRASMKGYGRRSEQFRSIMIPVRLLWRIVSRRPSMQRNGNTRSR